MELMVDYTILQKTAKISELEHRNRNNSKWNTETNKKFQKWKKH